MLNGKRGMDYYYGSPTIIRDCTIIIIIHSDPLPPETDPLVTPHNTPTDMDHCQKRHGNSAGNLRMTWVPRFFWDYWRRISQLVRCYSGPNMLSTTRERDLVVNPKNSGHFDSHSSAACHEAINVNQTRGSKRTTRMGHMFNGGGQPFWAHKMFCVRSCHEVNRMWLVLLTLLLSFISNCCRCC